MYINVLGLAMLVIPVLFHLLMLVLEQQASSPSLRWSLWRRDLR